MRKDERWNKCRWERSGGRSQNQKEENGEDKKPHILEMAWYKHDLLIVKGQMQEMKAGREKLVPRWQLMP